MQVLRRLVYVIYLLFKVWLVYPVRDFWRYKVLGKERGIKPNSWVIGINENDKD